MSINLSTIPPLSAGKHAPTSTEMCVMEAVAYIAGEPWTDHPECVSTTLGAFLRSWNDYLSAERRDALLRPLIPRLIGTRGDEALERRRSMLAADWLIRHHTPAWLRLAGLGAHADELAGLQEITDFGQCPALMPTLKAVGRDAAAARDAAWDTAWDMSWAVALDAESQAKRAAAGASAGHAALAAASHAAWDTAWVTAWNEAWTAARDAAGASTGASAGDAATHALAATVADLQKSALALIDRMIDARAA